MCVSNLMVKTRYQHHPYKGCSKHIYIPTLLPPPAKDLQDAGCIDSERFCYSGSRKYYDVAAIEMRI